jgi:hypothetical protein
VLGDGWRFAVRGPDSTPLVYRVVFGLAVAAIVGSFCVWIWSLMWRHW